MQAVLVFLVLFLTISVNLPDSVIARLGFDADILMAALVAVVMTGLIQHKNLLLIILVVFCSIFANMPDETMKGWGLNSDYFFGILVALVITPIGAKMSGKY
jgi:hypothetical protein